MHLNLLVCEIMVREVCWAVSQSPHICDLTFVDQGYHNTIDPGRAFLQNAIDAVPEGKYDAILLGYGLCNNLIAGLEARDTPLVVPRAHDCITIFLGDMDRYAEEFKGCPGTYYYSSGWLECAKRRGGVQLDQVGGNYTAGYEELVQKYGEDNAAYLMEALTAWTAHYERGALIRFEWDGKLGLDQRVREICEERGWRYEELPGSLDLLRRFVGGDWDERTFLTVPPRHRLCAAWDGGIVRAEPVAQV